MLLTTLLNYAIIMSTNKKGGRTNQERTATNQTEVKQYEKNQNHSSKQKTL